MNFPQAGGGVRIGAAKDLEAGATTGIFLLLILVIVFPRSIPPTVVKRIQGSTGSVIAIGIVLLLSYLLGPMAGLFAALSFLFVWSQRQRIPEGFSVGPVLRPTLLVTSPVEATIVPNDHRWFVERVLKEHPYIIEDDRVKTLAVQDDSEAAQYNSRVSR